MNVFFDLDGTLTDLYPGITRCLAYALEKLGRPAPPPARLKWCIGPPLKESFSELLATGDNRLLQRAVSLYRERFGSVGLFENDVYEGVPDMLDALGKMGHALYVTTAKPQLFAARIVDHFGLRPYFTGVYGSERDGTSSDKPSLLAYVLKRASIPVSNAVVVGDREHDMIGAQANGMIGLRVLWGYGSREELASSGHGAASPRRRN